MCKYNLVEEGWIPCLMGDGTRESFGLRDVLVRAPDIREIFHESP